MLEEMNLLKNFYAEETNKIVFLQNKLPTKAVKNQTPLKHGIGTNLKLSFLNSLVVLFFCFLSFLPCIPHVK